MTDTDAMTNSKLLDLLTMALEAQGTEADPEDWDELVDMALHLDEDEE